MDRDLIFRKGIIKHLDVRAPGQGNVKVGAKSLVLVVFRTSKSEIRISKLETISNFEYQMTKTFQTFIHYLRGSSHLGSRILVIRICFRFRASCLEFMENRISKQFSLSQQVISLNDVALPPARRDFGFRHSSRQGEIALTGFFVQVLIRPSPAHTPLTRPRPRKGWPGLTFPPSFSWHRVESP